MAYDEGLAERIRDTLSDLNDTTEMKMFGGLAFLLNGNMAVGIVKDDLMVRVGAEAHDDLLALPGARPMDFSGRPMKGTACEPFSQSSMLAFCHICRLRSVSMNPGAMQFTWMPCLPHSAASALVNCASAPLVIA